MASHYLNSKFLTITYQALHKLALAQFLHHPVHNTNKPGSEEMIGMDGPAPERTSRLIVFMLLLPSLP